MEPTLFANVHHTGLPQITQDAIDGAGREGQATGNIRDRTARPNAHVEEYEAVTRE
jgi:hypothetical protein